jgi:hypothetical protein
MPEHPDIFKLSRAEVEMILLRHREAGPAKVGHFLSEVQQRGGPALDFSGESLKTLWPWAVALPGPKSIWPQTELEAQELPWWIPSYGSWLRHRRIGPELCWLVDGMIAYVAECLRRIDPSSDWHLSNGRQDNADFNRIRFQVNRGLSVDLIFALTKSYVNARFPDRDPDELDDFEQTWGFSPPKSRQRSLYEIFSGCLIENLPPEFYDDDVEEEELTLEEFKGRWGKVWVREDIAMEDANLDRIVEVLCAQPEVVSAVSEDREVIAVEFVSKIGKREARKILKRVPSLGVDE